MQAAVEIELGKILKEAEEMVTRRGWSNAYIGSCDLGSDENELYMVKSPLSGDRLIVDRDVYHDVLQTRYGAMFADKSRTTFNGLIQLVASGREPGFGSYCMEFVEGMNMGLYCSVTDIVRSKKPSISWAIVVPYWRFIIEGDVRRG